MENIFLMTPNMEKFESIGKVFENREDFIPQVGEQLREKRVAEVEVGGEKLFVDYRIISVEEKENKDSDPVVLLSGFGSGWEGVAELGFSLACEGRKVIMPSLPGYGNSQNPSKEYYETGNFDNEAEVVEKLIEKLDLDGKKIHLVGHSMGSEILATMAEKYPEKISSLVLLNPAGVNENENIAALSAKFLLSGAYTAGEYNVRAFFSGEKEYEKGLYAHIQKTKSPFAKERIAQRLSEVKKVSKGKLLKKLENIEVPLTFIAGELDRVYPPGSESDKNSQLSRIMESINNNGSIEKSVMHGLRHNTTFAPDEITAANIDHYLEVAEKKK